METFLFNEHTKTLQIAEWESRFPQLLAGFTLRMEGCSEEPYSSFNMGLHVGDREHAVIVNRRALSERIRMSFDSWTCADQVHGTKVVRVTSAERGCGKDNLQDVIKSTDGLHTNEPDILLTSFYADCVPLYFLDPVRKAVGLAHAGWKGTVGRISKEMVKAFQQEYGSREEDLLVAIGPSIGQCCYEVDERVISFVKQSVGTWQEAVTAKENGRYMLDLRKLNQLILLDAGLHPKQIASTNYCTSCRVDLFYSFRKENGKTGRMASYIGWKE